MTEPIVVAYSGSGEASAAIARLAREHGGDVVTLTLDVGQGRDVAEIRDRALSLGAARAHVLDVREEFARDYAIPALKGAALPDVAALARPLVAAKLAEVAAIENTRHVLDGFADAAPDHLLCRPVVDASRAPDSAAQIELVFEGGFPVAINGVPMSITELIDILSLIAGRHGVGRIAAAEAPAAVVLHAAYAALPAPGGLVRLSLLKGQHHIMSVESPAPRLVTHA